MVLASLLFIAGIFAHGGFMSWREARHNRFRKAMNAFERFLTDADIQAELVDNFSCRVTKKIYPLNPDEIQDIISLAAWNESEAANYISNNPRSELAFAECHFAGESQEFRLTLEDSYRSPASRGPQEVTFTLFINGNEIAKRVCRGMFFVTQGANGRADSFHWEDSEQASPTTAAMNLYFEIKDQMLQKLWLRMMELMATRLDAALIKRMESFRTFMKG